MRSNLLPIPLLLVLLVAAWFAAGCGSDATSPAKSTVSGAFAQGSSGSVAGATASDVASCLGDAGFAQGPPSHGVSAQFSADDGTVVARSTDPAQVATTASELGGTAIGTAGWVIAGSSRLADIAKDCVDRAAG